MLVRLRSNGSSVVPSADLRKQSLVFRGNVRVSSGVVAGFVVFGGESGGEINPTEANKADTTLYLFSFQNQLLC